MAPDSSACTIAPIRGAEAYFLVGPTAVGKTRVAHRIAQESGGRILSADSMAVYRGMDVGTAKPTAEDRAVVRYYGLDLVDPDRQFSAGEYLERARDAFAECSADGVPLFVVGGTGLYVRALLSGFDTEAADRACRARAKAVYEADGIEGLHRALDAADAGWRGRIEDPRNPRRLVRALERTYADAPSVEKTVDSVQAGRILGLCMERDPLRRRIADRVAVMFRAGLIEEAAELRARWGQLSGTASAGIGYAEAYRVMDGTMTLAEAVEKTGQRTSQLAKRQGTWFRHQANVEWMEMMVTTSPADAAGRVAAWWAAQGPAPCRGVEL